VGGQRRRQQPSAIDAGTNKVATTVTGIEAPHNVQVGPDGTVWAVSGSNALVALDPATYELIGTAATGGSPAHVVITPDGRRVYVTNAGEDTVGVYDAATLEHMATVEVGDGPHGLRPSGDGEVIVVANTTAGTIDVVQTATNEVSASIPVGDSPAQVAVDDDGDYAYVTLAGDGAVAKVDLAGQTVVKSVEVSAPPVQLYLTPDGTRLLSADQGTEQAPGARVSVIDTETMKVTESITTGSGPHGVVVDTTGETAWVTNLYDDTVSVLDLTTSRVVATVPVGEMPNGVSYSATPPAAGAPRITVTIPDYAEDEPPSGHGHG